MTFQPGQSGNPSGYKGPRWGNRHKIHREVLELIQGLGHKDCLVTLSEIQNDPNKDPAVRVSAAIGLAKHVHPGLQAIPSPILIHELIDLPPPTTIEIAKDNISKLISAYGRGECDQASYDRLIAGNVAMINALLGQDKLNYAHGVQPETTIRIQGGLPVLPGCENLIMPTQDQINGKGYQLLDHQRTNPSSIDGLHTDTTHDPVT